MSEMVFCETLMSRKAKKKNKISLSSKKITEQSQRKNARKQTGSVHIAWLHVLLLEFLGSLIFQGCGKLDLRF